MRANEMIVVRAGDVIIAISGELTELVALGDVLSHERGAQHPPDSG